MKNALETEQSPLDANLEKVIPGVHEWHKATHQAINRVTADMHDFREATVQKFQEQEQRLSNMSEQAKNNQRALAITLFRVADMLARGASGDFLQEAIDDDMHLTEAPSSPSVSTPIRHPFGATNGSHNLPNCTNQHTTYREQ